MPATEDEDGPAEGTGMELPDLKKMLVRSRNGPVNCALALGDPKEGGLALIMMDRTKPPKALVKALKEQFPGLRNPCFGTASVDADQDAKQVTFNLNKKIAGMDRKLKKSLKGTGFTKVVIEMGQADEAE